MRGYHLVSHQNRARSHFQLSHPIRLNHPTLLSDISIQAAGGQVPDGVRILKFVARNRMCPGVCDIVGDGDMAETGNSADISRQLSNTLEPRVTVSKQHRSLRSDGVGWAEPVARDRVDRR